MKLFISQPMADKTDQDIKAIRNKVVEMYKISSPDIDIELIDSFFEGAPHDAKPLWFLGKSFELLSTADQAVFVGDWENYRGCRLEHEACKAYDIPIHYLFY